MKKYLMLVLSLTLFVFAGCTTSSVSDTTLSEAIAQANNANLHTTNHQKTYYSYYLSPAIGRIDGDNTSNIFDLNGQRFVVNLNVTEILRSLNSDMIDENQPLFQQNQAIFQYEDVYTDLVGNEISYKFEIYEVDNQYLVYFDSDTLEMFSICYDMNLPDMIQNMLYLARSTIVYSDIVSQDFNTQDIITYETKKVELFENLTPENGTIDELLIDSEKESVSQDDEK